MQICANWTCLIAGILAIVAAIVIFYLIGLFTKKNNHQNHTNKSINDKEYRANRPGRQQADQPSLTPRSEDTNLDNDDEVA